MEVTASSIHERSKLTGLQAVKRAVVLPRNKRGRLTIIPSSQKRLKVRWWAGRDSTSMKSLQAALVINVTRFRTVFFY